MFSPESSLSDRIMNSRKFIFVFTTVIARFAMWFRHCELCRTTALGARNVTTGYLNSLGSNYLGQTDQLSRKPTGYP